jgi:hypothetical protein
MATKKTASNQKISAGNRGGSREGSGRPITYSLLEKMAIALRVAEIQKEQSCTQAEAIRKMKTSGELPPGTSNIGRYLAPSHLNPKIDRILREVLTRTGIVGAIPLPKKTRTKKGL